MNYAVAVGYSRHLVGWLFASWPESEDIMSAMLDDIDPQNIVGLLDLIQGSETKEHFQKVGSLQLKQNEKTCWNVLFRHKHQNLHIHN